MALTSGWVGREQGGNPEHERPLMIENGDYDPWTIHLVKTLEQGEIVELTQEN